MNDLDEALTGALNAAAHEDEVHLERLLTNARAAGLRYRRRRRILLAGGGALTAVLPALLVLVGLTFYGGGPGPAIESGSGPIVPSATAASTVAPATPLPTPTAGPPQLPVLTTAVPVQKSASLVGRGAFHIGLTGVPFGVATMQWTSGAGLERVLLTTESASGDQKVTIVLARGMANLSPLDGQKQTVSVGAHRATLASQPGIDPPYTVVRWQPSTGLWAEVSGTVDEKDALSLANQVTFERTYACVVPFTLRPRPPTLAGIVSACSVGYAAGSWTGQFTYDYGTWTLDVGRSDEAGMDFKETLGGRPAWTDRGSGGGSQPTLRVQVSYGGNRVADLKAAGKYSTTTVTDIATGYEMIDSLNPADWWQVPVG